jgi:Na+-driven multidrug efflux pump
MGTAAFAVANSLTGIEVIPGLATGLALTTIVARCVGANEYEQAKNYIRQIMKLAYICLIAFNLPMLLILKPLLEVYNLSPETFDLAFKIVLIHGISAMLVRPVSFVLPNAFWAASDVKYPMAVSIVSMIVFRVGFSYIVAYTTGLGVLSVWFAMSLGWMFRRGCFSWRYFRGVREKISLQNG